MIAVHPADWYRRNAATLAEKKRRKNNSWDYSLAEIQECARLWESRGEDGAGAYKRGCLNPYCRAEHWAKRRNKRYCSKQCAYFMFQHPYRECGACGNTFWRKRRDAKWCSDNCRYRAYRRRKAIAEGRGLAYPYTYVVGETRPRYRGAMRGKKRKHRPAGKVITVIKW